MHLETILCCLIDAISLFCSKAAERLICGLIGNIIFYLNGLRWLSVFAEYKETRKKWFCFASNQRLDYSAQDRLQVILDIFRSEV